ncbi:hypothetical protein KSX_63700 [Ktedonospora formicarum]|uniref:Uncharacterized protein n=1 Tax=Ktedonospora formicarum TaxID=2778364 RepID=A0A8J3MTG3_9CHLR|nr:hypothetical protein KSX_63700 [Ktedonospora formicarum]
MFDMCHKWESTLPTSVSKGRIMENDPQLDALTRAHQEAKSSQRPAPAPVDPAALTGTDLTSTEGVDTSDDA